jgi:hypothetical protein
MKVRTLKEIIQDQMLLSLRPIPGDGSGGGDGGGDGGGGDDDPGGGTVIIIPGTGINLSYNLRKRYTSNVAISDEIPLTDLIHEVILVACRGYLTQGANGKIRMHNKKPVDYAYGISAFSGDEIEVDNAQPWVDSLKYFIVVDPHTNKSEVRQVMEAVYPTSQNSITLTSNEPTEITVTAFSGADGASTPATATIDTSGIVAATNYIITLNGFTLEFIPSSGDIGESVASFLKGAINAHPKLNRQFIASWAEGDEFLTVQARNGVLTLNSDLAFTHAAPVADPITAPTLTENVGAGDLAAGEYLVAYTFKNVRGQTLLSEFKAITVSASATIDVSAVTPPADCTVVWYVSPEANSTKLRHYLENDGSGFTIDWPLPKLSASLPPDLNRTGTEIMRVVAVFSDREEERSDIGASNVMRGTFEWQLANRRKVINRIDVEYREAAQDWRLIELRERDDAHIAKIHKANNEKINGQAIDNYFQAKRIATGLLAEKLDADFFYEWSSTRRALLLEEGDVVAITDDGSGVINLPVMIQEMEIDADRAGLPEASFTAQKYYSTLYDDAVNEITVPIVSEIGDVVEEEPEPEPPEFAPDDITGLVRWYRPEGLAAFADNDPIGTWPDDSAANVDATQSSTARPIRKDAILNGQPIVRFDGSNDYFNIGDLSALTEGEAFLVIKLDTDPPSDPQSGLWNLGDAGTSDCHFPYIDGVIYDSFGTTARKTTVNPTPSLSAAFHIYSVYSASADWANSLDGVSLFSTGTNTVSFSAVATLGTSLSIGRFLDGDIAEFILYDHKLSTGDRADVMTYLQDKFGL